MGRYPTKPKVFFVLGCALILLLKQTGYAQESAVATTYPNRPITYIVPLPPGGGTDPASRMLSREAEKILGQPIVHLYKPGAALTIGTTALSVAKPDGYTIGYLAGPAMFITPFLEKVPYDAIRDFRMIIQWGGTNFGIVVRADSPFKSFGDLINYARSNSQKLTYGTSGTNSLQHITVRRIAKTERVEMTHIPFKGTSESQAALLGGHIDFLAGDFNYSLIEAGQLRLLLLLKEERSAEYPQTPILKDLGYDYPYPMHLAIGGPKAMPDAVVEKLEGAYSKAMKQPAFIKAMQDLHYPIVYRSSKDMNEYVARNYETFKRLIKEGDLVK